MAWTYEQTEPRLWTVMSRDGDRVTTDSDHDSRDDAAARVAYLNGGVPAVPQDLREMIRAEVVQEVTSYMDGDPENGPRDGSMSPTADEIDAEVDLRHATTMRDVAVAGSKGAFLGHIDEARTHLHDALSALEDAVQVVQDADGPPVLAKQLSAYMIPMIERYVGDPGQPGSIAAIERYLDDEDGAL